MKSENFGPVIRLFGIDIDRASLQEATQLLNALVSTGGKELVVTPNVDHLIHLNNDPGLFSIYQKATYRFPDGMPIVWFSHLLPPEYHLKERVTGADLVVSLLETSHDQQTSIGFLGGAMGKAEDILARLRKLYPNANIRGVITPPFGFESDPELVKNIVEQINDWEVDHLLVGLGFPKQERFILDHWDELHFKVAMGVGAGIDMVVGYKKRAPKWVRNSGFEWFWRFLQEPIRLFDRYFMRDVHFFSMAWKEYRRIRKENK